MSAFVRVRHFLSEEGMKEFDSVLAGHQLLASAFPGFISLQHSRPNEPERNQEACVTVEFENEVLLMRWRSSPQHEQIAARYRRCWTREPEILLYSVEI